MAGGVACVMFTDLVGSTELMARLGDTAFDAVRAEHFSRLTAALTKAGGTVVKTTGDGLLVTFASAVDALAAAVAAQQVTHRHAPAAEVPLSIRVGLALGEVASEGGDVFGTPVVEAARLVAAARPGQILCTALLRAVAGSRAGVGLTDRGVLELKGLPDPVPVSEVAWEPESAETSPLPLPPLLTGPGRIFVGRDAELEQIRRAWKAVAAEGGRRLVLLAGEPGIGKTRLATELARSVHAEGAVVLGGRCDEDLGVPYQPFVEALRHYATHARDPRLGRYPGELTRLSPELGELVSGLPDPVRSDPETERYRLFDAITGWLADVSVAAPLLLVLDDLHWAAKPTILMLRHVLRAPEPARLLVAVTYRDTDIGRGHPLTEFLADLRREREGDRFSLAGLDREGVGAFIEAAAGHTLPGEEGEDYIRAVWEETEGNPFFVAEVIRHLTETEAIELRKGRWVLTAPVEELGIPEGIRDVVGRRLSRLPEGAERVLGLAAVAGLEFETAVLAAAGEFDEDGMFSALEAAASARLLVELPGGTRYRFSHALVRATLYDEISAARRVALHRRLAETIEAIHRQRLDDYLPALAHHWARACAPAADADRAVEYATRAGDRALTQLAHDEAAAYYAQALELLDVAGVPADDPRRQDLLISRGQAQQRAGDPAHRETLLAAVELARSRGDAGAMARAALANLRGPWFSSAHGVDAERVGALEAALAAQPGAADSDVRARLLAALALERFWDRDGILRRQLSDEALAMARRLDSPTTLAYVLSARPFAIGSPDTLEERLAGTAELITLAEQLNDPVLLCRSRGARLRVLMEEADVERAERELDRFSDLAADLGQPTLQWTAGLGRVARSILHCRLDDAEREAEAVFELGRTSGQPDARAFWALHQFSIRHEQGRLAEVEALLTEVHAAVAHLPAWSGLMAMMFSEMGRGDDVRRLLAPMKAAGFDLPFDTTWLYGTSGFAQACAGVEDGAAAAVLLERLAPYRSHLATTAWGLTLGAVAHTTGRLASLLGRFDEAEAEFQAAESLHQQMGAPGWLARTRLEWGSALLQRGKSGYAQRAFTLVEQALATATEFALPAVERRARSLLLDARGEPGG